MARPRIGIVILVGLCIYTNAATAQGSQPDARRNISFIDSSNYIKRLHLSSIDDSLLKLLDKKALFKAPIENITQQWNEGLLRINSLKQEADKLFANPIKFSEAIATYDGNTDYSHVAGDNSCFFNNTQIRTSWSMAGIPLEINYNNQTWSAFPTQTNVFSVRFDREQYLQALKKKLGGAIDPSKFLDNVKDPLAALKNSALNSLEGELETINRKYHEVLSAKMSEIGDRNKLFTKDIVALRQQLLDKRFLQVLQEQQVQLANLVQQRNNGKAIDVEQIAALEKSIKAGKGVEELLKAVEQHQRKWKTSGLITKMKEWDVLKGKQLSTFLSSPSAIASAARSNLNLSGLQRLFLKISRLNAGQQAVTSSPLSIQNLLSKGLMSEFQENKKYLMLFAGSMNNNRGAWDMPFTENINSVAGNAKAIRIGKTGLKGNYSHVSIMSFDQSFQSFYNISSLPVTWKSLVTTISNQMPVGEKGTVRVELSRSATSFVNDDASRSATSKITSGAGLADNMAFSVVYEDEHPESGLSYQVRANHTARGYDNPGNPYLNNGATEVGYRLRKSFMKNKLQLSLRTDLREYRYSAENRNKWSNVYNIVDFKWKLRRGNFVALRYMPNRMSRVTDKGKERVTAIDRVSAETSFSGKLWNKAYRNYVTLSFQGNEYTMGVDNLSNRSLVISSFQSIVLSKKLLYLNSVYNNSRNSSAIAYFNSSFLAECGFTYMLFGKISGSSAIVYNSVSRWYNQGGVRQTLSGQLSDKFNINLYIDARRNFHLYQPLMTSPVRADISLQYVFKK